MDAYDQLRKQASDRRDVAIRNARVEYRETIRRINALVRSLKQRTVNPLGRRKVRPAKDRAFYGMNPIQAAEAVLMDGCAYTAVELALAIQARGCCPADPPERVVRNLQSSLYYHRARFDRSHGRYSLRQGVGHEDSPDTTAEKSG